MAVPSHGWSKIDVVCICGEHRILRAALVRDDVLSCMDVFCVKSFQPSVDTKFSPEMTAQLSDARCVSHNEKTFVVYHKVTVFFACGNFISDRSL